MPNRLRYKIILFTKEMFGGRKKLIFFIIFSILVYILVAVQVVLSYQTTEYSIIPDIIFAGAPSGNTITYNKYEAVKKGASDAITKKLNGKAKSYDLIERNIITVQKDNSLESVTYSIFACTHDFFSDIISPVILEGRIPENGKREAIVGGYLAKAFDIKIGDTISKKGVELKGIGKVDIVLDLSGNFDEIEYQIVGILNNTNAYFDYSFLLESETQAGSQSNQIWTYFLDESAVDDYISNIVDADSTFFNEFRLSSVAETYRNKDTGIGSLLLKNMYLFLLVVVFCVIEVAYLLKGVAYKLGVMKALGTSNHYIYSCYFVGVLIIQLLSYLVSLLIMTLVCNMLNRTISNAYGFEAVIYSISFTHIAFITLLFFIILLTFWLSLWYRVNHITPKTAMNAKN